MHMHNSRAKRERAKNSGGRCSVREGKKEESKESGGRERVRAESIGGGREWPQWSILSITGAGAEK